MCVSSGNVKIHQGVVDMVRCTCVCTVCVFLTGMYVHNVAVIRAVHSQLHLSSRHWRESDQPPVTIFFLRGLRSIVVMMVGCEVVNCSMDYQRCVNHERFIRLD